MILASTTSGVAFASGNGGQEGNHGTTKGGGVGRRSTGHGGAEGNLYDFSLNGAEGNRDLNERDSDGGCSTGQN